VDHPESTKRFMSKTRWVVVFFRNEERDLLEMTSRTTTATIVAAALLRAWLGAWF